MWDDITTKVGEWGNSGSNTRSVYDTSRNLIDQVWTPGAPDRQVVQKTDWATFMPDVKDDRGVQQMSPAGDPYERIKRPPGGGPVDLSGGPAGYSAQGQTPLPSYVDKAIKETTTEGEYQTQYTADGRIKRPPPGVEPVIPGDEQQARTVTPKALYSPVRPVDPGGGDAYGTGDFWGDLPGLDDIQEFTDTEKKTWFWDQWGYGNQPTTDAAITPSSTPTTASTVVPPSATADPLDRIPRPPPGVKPDISAPIDVGYVAKGIYPLDKDGAMPPSMAGVSSRNAVTFGLSSMLSAVAAIQIFSSPQGGLDWWMQSKLREFTGEQRESRLEEQGLSRADLAVTGGSVEGFQDRLPPAGVLTSTGFGPTIYGLGVVNAAVREGRAEFIQQFNSLAPSALKDILGGGVNALDRAALEGELALDFGARWLGEVSPPGLGGLNLNAIVGVMPTAMAEHGEPGTQDKTFFAYMGDIQAATEMTDTKAYQQTNAAIEEFNKTYLTDYATYTSVEQFSSTEAGQAVLEEQESLSRFVGFLTHSGADAVKNYMNDGLDAHTLEPMYLEQAKAMQAQIEEARNTVGNPYTESDMIFMAMVAADLGAKAKQLGDIMHHDIYGLNSNPVYEAAALTLFDPDMMVDAATALLKIGPISGRIAKAVNVTSRVVNPATLAVIREADDVAFGVRAVTGAADEAVVGVKAAGGYEEYGWKLHLNIVSPENQEIVSKWLKSQGIPHKIGRSSGQEGKNLTIYVGDKNLASDVASQVNEQFSSILEQASKNVVKDDTQFSGNVYGRFDIGTKDSIFAQYGSSGIPYIKDQQTDMLSGGSTTPQMARSTADTYLRNKYGSFYSGGSIDNTIASILDAPYKEADDAAKVILDMKAIEDSVSVGNYVRNRVLTGFGLFAPTLESQVQRTMQTTNGLINYLSLGIESPQDFAKIIKTFVVDSPLLAEGKMFDGAQLTDKSLAGYKWDSAALFTEEAQDARKSLQAVATDIDTMLDSAGADVDIGFLANQVMQAAGTGTVRKLGGETDLAAKVPFTAVSAKRLPVQKGVSGFPVGIYDEAENLISTVAAATKTKAEENLNNIYSMIVYSGNRTGKNRLRIAGQIQRELASQMFIIGNAATVQGNAISGAFHAVTDGVFSLRRYEDSMAMMQNLAGALDPSFRLANQAKGGSLAGFAGLATHAADATDEVYTNLGVLKAAGTGATEPGKRTTYAGKVADVLHIPELVKKPFTTYGDVMSELFGGNFQIGLGNKSAVAMSENANVVSQMAKVAERVMNDQWGKVQPVIMKGMADMNLPEEMLGTINNILADVPYTGYESAATRIGKIVDGIVGDTSLTLADLGMENVTSLTPQARNTIAKIMADGGEDVVPRISKIITDDMNVLEHILLEVPLREGRTVFTDRDLAAEGSSLMDDFIHIASKSGIARKQAEETYSPIVKRMMEAPNLVREAIAALPNTSDASNLAIDFVNRLDTALINAHDNNDKLFKTLIENADGPMPERWERYLYATGETWTNYSIELESYAKNVHGQIMDMRSGKSSVDTTPSTQVWDRIQRAADANQEKVAEYAATEVGAAINAAGEVNKLYNHVIQAMRIKTSHSMENMWTMMRRYPDGESFDIVLNAHRNIDQYGYMSNAIVAGLRKELGAKAITAQDFYKRRNQTWRELADITATQSNLAVQAMGENFVNKVAQTTDILSGVDTTDAKAVQEALSDLRRIAAAEVRDIVQAPFKPVFPVSGVTDDINADAQRLVGLVTASEDGTPVNAAIRNFANSPKTATLAADYSIEIPQSFATMNRVEDLNPADKEILHRLIKTYAWEEHSDNLPPALRQLRNIMDDSLAQNRQARPFSTVGSDLFPWTDDLEDVSGQYNKWSTANANQPQGSDPTTAESAAWRLNRIEILIKNLTESAGKTLTPGAAAEGQIPPAARAGIAELLNITGRQGHSKAAFGALNAAKETSSFTMINHAGGGRFIDDIIGMFVPFHFFYTRSGKNMLERMLKQPYRMSVVNTLNTLPDRISRDNETMNTKWQGHYIHEGEDRRWGWRMDPQRVLPFTPASVMNNYGDPSREMSWYQRAFEMGDKMGFGASPWWKALADVGESGGDMKKMNLTKFSPQTNIIAQAALASTLDGRVIDWLRKQSPEYVMMGVASQMAAQGRSDEEQYLGQEYIAQLWNDLEEIKGTDYDKVYEIYEQAENEYFREELIGSITGWFSLLRAKVDTQGQVDLDTNKLRRRLMGVVAYNPKDGPPVVNEFGSAAAKSGFDQLEPGLAAEARRRSMFGPADDKTDDDGQPVQNFSIYGQQIPETYVQWLDKSLEAIEWSWSQPAWSAQKEQYKLESRLLYAEMRVDVDAYIVKAQADGKSVKEINAGQYDVTKEYYNDEGTGKIDELKDKYAPMLNATELNETYSRYPYLNLNEMGRQVMYDIADKVQDDFPLPAYPGKESSYAARKEYYDKRDLALENRKKAADLAFSDMNMALEMTGGAPLSEEQWGDMMKTLDGMGTPLDIDPRVMKLIADERIQFGASPGAITTPDTAGMLAIADNSRGENALLTEKNKYDSDIQGALALDYAQWKKDNPYGGGGGGRRRRGGRGRGGGGGGGGGSSYAARANIRIDPFRGLGSGLMTTSERQPWTPNQNRWQWYSQPDRTPLPRYRALGR